MCRWDCNQPGEISVVMTDEATEKLYQLRLGKELLEFTQAEIKADPALEAELKVLERRKAECELGWFVPHGKAGRAYDAGFDIASMPDWIHDQKHDIYINQSPNQVGKTCHAVVKCVLKMIPCNPKWPIFLHGIDYHDWQGKKTLVAFGYDKSHIKEDLWPELQKWIPAEQLGPFKAVSLGGTKEPSWHLGPTVDLKCGSRIILLTYDQLPSVCCGIKANLVLANEQMPLAFFMELSQRGRTLEGIKFIMPYTPHSIPGRPESGANSFLTDLWTGNDTRGHTVLRTRISVDDVPDHIYSKEQKRKAFIEHVENPKKTGNQAAIREGMARYYGIAQQVSGLYYPEIDNAVHYVDWTYEDIKKKGWTHYRSVDYGYNNPTACAMWAVSPAGDMFMYDEYYKTGMDAIQHAPAIVAACGNDRKLVKKMLDKAAGVNYDVYDEVEIRQKYARTYLDWHSFQTAGGVGRPVSFFFQIGGLKVVESTKIGQEHRAQNLRALLKIDPNRKHMITGNLGAPRIYFSRKCAKFRWEIERCVTDMRAFGNETHNIKETKRNKDDHLIDAVEYFASSDSKYMGDYANNKPGTMKNVSKHGGY